MCYSLFGYLGGSSYIHGVEGIKKKVMFITIFLVGIGLMFLGKILYIMGVVIETITNIIEFPFKLVGKIFK